MTSVFARMERKPPGVSLTKPGSSLCAHESLWGSRCALLVQKFAQITNCHPLSAKGGGTILQRVTTGVQEGTLQKERPPLKEVTDGQERAVSWDSPMGRHITRGKHNYAPSPPLC